MFGIFSAGGNIWERGFRVEIKLNFAKFENKSEKGKASHVIIQVSAA